MSHSVVDGLDDEAFAMYFEIEEGPIKFKTTCLGFILKLSGHKIVFLLVNFILI